MKIESRIFEVVAGFCFIMAVVYGLWAKEPVGIVALTLTGGLCLITGTYFRVVARRIPARPEDDVEAEISDGAGELGFGDAPGGDGWADWPGEGLPPLPGWPPADPDPPVRAVEPALSCRGSPLPEPLRQRAAAICPARSCVQP